MVGAVKLLLSLGADPLVHSESEQYDTALHRAALCGHQECAEIILCQDPQTLSETDRFVLLLYVGLDYSLQSNVFVPNVRDTFMGCSLLKGSSFSSFSLLIY